MIIPSISIMLMLRIVIIKDSDNDNAGKDNHDIDYRIAADNE